MYRVRLHFYFLFKDGQTYNVSSYQPFVNFLCFRLARWFVFKIIVNRISTQMPFLPLSATKIAM